MWLFLLFLPFVYGCDFTAEINSETYIPFYGQFTFHNGTLSKLYYFDFDHRIESVHITGIVCNMKPTIFKVWKEKKPESKDAKPFGQTSAFLEGMGKITYTIYPDNPPRVGTRLGVACGFGDCGGRGK